MAEAKVLYLAGDTGNPPEWIEPDTEHLFLDETGGWSRMEGGAQAEPITCPIVTTEIYEKSTEMGDSLETSANYADIANALAFFVPNAGGNATSGGSRSIKFSDGSHAVTLAKPSGVNNAVFNGIAPFAFIGDNKVTIQCDATSNGPLIGGVVV